MSIIIIHFIVVFILKKMFIIQFDKPPRCFLWAKVFQFVCLCFVDKEFMF